MSSVVVATPEAFAAASQDLTGIGAAIRAANAAAPTTGIAAAAHDEVSAGNEHHDETDRTASILC
jgi:hypothetical protein